MKASNFKFIIATLIISTLITITSCSPPKEVEKVTLLYKTTIDLEDSLSKSKTEGDAHGGKFFSRADTVNIYGNEMIFNIPDSLLQKGIRVKVNLWARLGDLNSTKKYAFSLEDASRANMGWGQIDLRSHISEPNKWVNIIDSVTFVGELINKSGAIIKSYSFNVDGKTTLDCDDVELSFYKVEKIKAE